jgi:hypothetical protein
VAFTVRASRGQEAATTVRLSVVVAVAKGLALVEEGWQVFIVAPDGARYDPSELDRLLSLSPALQSRECFNTSLSQACRPTCSAPT